MKRIALVFSLAAVLVASSASAANAIVVTREGQILNGRVVEIVNGDHLTMDLPSGQRQTLAWNDVFTIKIEDGPAPAPGPVAPPAPPVAAPAFAAAPAPYASPMKDAPPPPPVTTTERHRPSLELAAAGGFISMSGDLLSANGRSFAASSMIGDGAMSRFDLGVRFSRAWTFYGSYEYDAFGKGTGTGDADAPVGHAASIGFKAISNPRGPVSFLFDVGAGFRWLRMPAGEGNMAVASGPVPLRMAIGGSFAITPHLRIDAAAGVAVGQLTKFALPQRYGCVNGDRSDCDSIPDSNRTWHVARTVTLGGVFTL